MTRLPVEICLSGATPAVLEANLRAARDGGARRVELCSRMGRQGLSPWPWQLRLAAAMAGSLELVVMTRPQEGFAASPELLERMLHELERAAAAGAASVALGVLQGKSLDLPAMRRLVNAARGLGLLVTCHRAFDAVADQDEALDALVEMGVARLLSSGLAWPSGDPAGREEALATLAAKTAGRLELVLAGGISAGTAPGLLRALPPAPCRFSLHAWSGVRRAGRTSAERVRSLVMVAHRPA